MKPRTLIVVGLSAAVGAVVAASATGLTVTSGSLAVLSAPTPTTIKPSPVSLTIANKATGGTAGKPEEGDTISVRFSHPLDLGTVCKDWDGRTSREVAVTITPEKLLLITKTNDCTGSSGLRFAKDFTLGGDYNAGDKHLSFDGTVKSKLEWLSASSTLRITLGTPCTGNSCGAAATVSSTATATYTTASGIKTSSGDLDVTGSISSTAIHF